MTLPEKKNDLSLERYAQVCGSELTLSHWDGEVSLSICHLAHERGQLPYIYPLSSGYEYAVLLHKPPRGRAVFEFSLQSRNCEFLYQPPLKNLALDGSTWEISPWSGTRRRPAKVNNSYAIYYKDCPPNIVGKKVYGVGKWLHLYRPLAYDLYNPRLLAWGDMEIDREVLRIEFPRAFFQKAKRPVIDPDFGYTTQGGSTDNAGGNFICAQAAQTPGDNGTLDSISAYIACNEAGSLNFNCAIYSDLTGAVKTLLAGLNTGGTAFSTTTIGLVTSNLTYAGLTSATQYWFGLVSHSTIDHKWAWDSGGTINYGGANVGDWPSDAPTGFITNSSSEKVSVYGTYSTGASTTPITVDNLPIDSLAGGEIV